MKSKTEGEWVARAEANYATAHIGIALYLFERQVNATESIASELASIRLQVQDLAETIMKVGQRL